MPNTVIYNRPRLKKILQEAAEEAFVLLSAGQGYGKTVALRQFASEHKNCALIRLSEPDNNPSYFWSNFTAEISAALPQSSAALSTANFPGNIEALGAALRVIAAELKQNRRTVIIFDDYSNIHSSSVLFFIEGLIEAHLQGLCVMAAASMPGNLAGAALRGGGSMQIIGEAQLAFNAGEAKELFEAYGIIISNIKSAKIVSFAGGWPLALTLIAHQIQAGVIAPENYTEVNLSMVYRIFSQSYFDNYTVETQQLLCHLALLDRFTIDVAMGLAELFSGGDIGALQHSMFIRFHQDTATYTFQSVYHGFLLEKRFLSTGKTIKKVYSGAGDIFYKNGYYMEAADCFCQSANYNKMLASISKLPLFRTDAHASEKILEYLLVPDDSFFEKYPTAVFIKAVMLLNLLNTDAALELLLELRLKLLRQPGQEAGLLLGEVYCVLGSICLMLNNSKFVEYYKAAAELLPGGSRFSFENQLILGCSGVIFLTESKSGNLRYVENLFHQAAFAMQHSLGGGQGLQWLFSAEARFCANELSPAKENAYRALHSAQKDKQYDIMCNAHAILARVNIMQGNYTKFLEHVNAVDRCAEEQASRRLLETRDLIIGWFYVEMGEAERMPKWLISGITLHPERPVFDYERSSLLYACYLFSNERNREALALLETIGEMCIQRGLWLDYLWVMIFSAIVCQRLGNKTAALEYLKAAYDMSWENEIIMPFIECGAHIQGALAIAEQDNGGLINSDWIKKIKTHSAIHAKRMSRMRRLPAPKKDIPRLTKREAEMLTSLAHGLTQQEMAEFYHISLSTVKSHLKNIYSKLGAVNRADAIHLATINNII